MKAVRSFCAVRPRIFSSVARLHGYNKLARETSKPTFAPEGAAAVSRSFSQSLALKMADPSSSSKYELWEKDRLISRIRQLENELKTGKAGQAGQTGRASPPLAANARRSGRSSPSSEAVPAPSSKKRKKGGVRAMDPSRYGTRFIALKLAYLGKRLGGFEHQPSANLPTVESELWAALTRACLIFPRNGSADADAVDFNDPVLEYSKCGRTDRGVSAFGQVIGIRVRSNRPMPRPAKEEAAGQAKSQAEGQAESHSNAATGEEGLPGSESVQDGATGDVEMKEATGAGAGTGTDAHAPPGAGETGTETKAESASPPAWDPVKNEIDYVRTLNKLLPSDIRILAWCPSPPPGFSARFSCRERQYRYFFTQPAFSPPPCSPKAASAGADARPKPGWLDIEAMREAARHFSGPHDFRNFCKVDGSKQITNFEREIFEVGIEEVPELASALPYVGTPGMAQPSEVNVAAGQREDEGEQGDRAVLPKVYAFRVRGSAFLWHQIRHMISVLFAVGQGFEKPSIVAELLDVSRHPRRPNYELAHDVPLVLWDCVFPDAGRGEEGGLQWLYEEEYGKHNIGGTIDSLWRTWREVKMDEMLANRLLDVVSRQGEPQTWAEGEGRTPPRPNNSNRAALHKVFLGGDGGRVSGSYVPMEKKQKLPLPEEVNDRWAQRKGFESAEDMRQSGNWRAAIREAKKGEAAPQEGGAGLEG